MDGNKVATSYRVGVDIGGTFTDIVLLGSDGTVHTKKVSSSVGNYAQAIVDGQTATDEAGRKAAYDSLQQVLVEEFPQIWMYRNDLDAIYQDDMGGLVAYGMGSWLLENFGYVG